MSKRQVVSIEVPAALSQLITVNIEYQVLLCLKQQCHKAVSPSGIVQHMRKIHNTEPQLRKQVREFVATGMPGWEYNHSTV